VTTPTDQTPENTAVAADSVEDNVLQFLKVRTKVMWDPDQDLFQSGAVSSLLAMELVVHLEKTFGITILGADLQMDNFRTVRAMSALVGRLRDTGTVASGG
jgi:methoxymalonate biosynthesis acyl carrier protein